MNVERATFVRRGYLVTALAVAVLLAASSGTAWAQTTTTTTASSRFARSSETRWKRAQARRRCHTGAPEGDHQVG